MVKWKLTPEVLKAREKAEKAAKARRAAAKAHLAKAGQTVDDDASNRVGTGAGSRSRLSKSQDNTIEITRQRRAAELQEKLKAAQSRLKDATLLIAGAKKLHAPALSRPSSSRNDTSGGWEPVKDEESGRTYYWNRQSNATSWVNPSESAKASSEIKPVKRNVKIGDFWVVVQVRKFAIVRIRCSSCLIAWCLM